MKKKLKGLLLVFLLIFIDQITKILAVSCLKDKSDFIILPGVLELHYLENQSAAFSIDPVTIFQKIFNLQYFNDHPMQFLQAKMIFFIILTIIVILYLLSLCLRIPDTKRFLPMKLILITFISGAAGNLIDRCLRKYVVDFIYFSLIDFPVFNVADIYVTCSAVLLVLAICFYYKEEDIERIFPAKKKD